MTDLDQARKRQIIKVAKAEDRLNVTAKPVYIPTSEQNDVIKHMEANYQQSKTPTTVGDTLRDMSVNLDLGANSGVNNFTTGLYGSAKFVYDNFGRAVNTPVVGAMALFNGEKVSDAIKESWGYEYTPSTKNFIEGLEKTIGLVPTHKYEEQMKPYLSDRYREDEEELDKATSTGSELQDFMNSVSYYYNNPRHLGMNAVKEVADMSASAALGLGASKAVGLGGKASASLVGEGFSSYGNASSELMERGVNPDSLNGVLTAGNIAGVNMLTQRVLNTRYSPENMLDNLLKSRAAKSISMNEARSSLLKIGVGAGAEAVEGVITGGHERIAINNATGKPLTEGVGRAIGEEVAIGASLGGASTTLGLANEKVSGLGKDNKLDLGKLFNEAQDISNQKLQKITDVANKYNIPFNSKFTNPDTKNPIQVAIMGDYSKKDTGKGTGDHYDLRLARDANGKRGDINPYLDRFMVNGKALSSYKQTGKYMEQRTGYKHEGVDYGFAGSFSKNPEARNLYINPKYKVTNITAFDNNKHGGGWVTQVTFSDGIKVNILHQNKEGALAIVDGFKQRKPVTASQYIKHKNLNLGATPYDDLMKEIYTKYGYTEQEQRILKAQLAQESGFNPKAVSHAGAKGIAQFLDGTAKQYGVDVNDVASSIDGQARFMRDLLKKSNGNWEMALAFYNAGAGSTDTETRFNKVKGIKETNQYYNNILANAGVNPDSIGIDTTSDVDGALNELNNLLSQLEQEEANAKTEEDKAKLQEQLNTLRTQLAEIANLDQQEQEIKEQGKQIFIDTFNDGVTELEIDENPFLNDEEKAEYKKQLGILRGDETNIDASEPSTIKPKTYDEIEQEYVVNTPVDGSTNQGHTELTNNEPIFTQRFSLSSTTPEEIDSNPNLTSNQKRAIHKMMDVQRQIADTRDVQDVTNDIIVGSVGNTIRESNRGLQDYITGFENAINANNIKAASDLLTDLQYLRDTRISKNNAINQALQLVEDNNIKDINDAPIIAQDADTKEWFITEYTGLREGYPEFDGSNALTIFKPNKLTERLDKEAKLVDDFTNAWADYLSDYNIEGTQAPTLDTSMATVTSKTANRATRSYDEAEATFKGGEFTQERVKSELPPLTETIKNPIDVKAGKIQLVQDINQVPEDGVFLGRGRYTDESGKSRPSSMYDMEQGRINVGDAGWLASPYNPPRQGYKPNPFTLADSKPSTHAEAYGSYFKRMFMRDDGFAKAVLELEPSKLYRTKYSTTEAQFIDSFLQNVPKESVEDARAWVTDKVYGIENGKPTFRASKIESTKEAKTTKPEASNKTEPNDTVEDFPVDTSEELTNLKLDEATLASVKEQLTGKSVKSQSNATESKDASTVENSPVDVSDELTELKLDKSTLASLKKQLTGKSAETESNDTKAKDASTEANTKETNTDSNEESSEPSLTGFKKQSTTVNSVFNNTPEQVEQEKSKHWQSQNHLILGFKQEADKPLVNILDLASNLENDLTAGIEELLPNIKATEAQIKQVKHFLDFNKAFVNSLKNSYHKEAIAADGRDYSFRDFKGYLQKEDGSFDENILTALSLSAYSHFIVNNKDINSYKDIGKLLNYPDDITIPSELLFKYKYVGDRYNNVVNSIGRTAYDLLGLKTNKDVSELYKGRMIASLGNWVVSSMVNEGLMYEASISNTELKKDSYDLDNTNDDETTDGHSIITLLSFTRLDGEGKKTLLDDIAEINKGTQGFLGRLFGGDVGLRSPTLEPTESINRDIRGTTAKVSDTQAKLQKHMQQEPIVINSDSFNSLHKLVEKFPEQAKTMIGAYISKDTLDSMHESKRVGAEAKAEGSNRELERLIGFTSGLDKDEEGNYQEFFDSNYVTKNNRGQYNSNEVNMQTMKIHRAMVDYKNFKQVIEANVLNNITGTETDFVVDGELTDLGHLFSAIAENAEGTEDVIENMLKHLTYRRGFTVDKVRAEDFLPAFFEHLETDEAVQTAVTSTQKLLEGKELSQSDMDNIQSVVDAWKMQALSFRALVEYAKFKQAQKDNTDLITSFGLGADGVNNGSAISYTLMGLMVNKQNPDLMNQIGVFTEESGFSTFHETRLKGLNDYYEGLGTIMEQELSTYEPDRKLVVNLFYRLNPSIQGRKGAKEVLIPAGYGAGTKRLLGVAFESLIRDVTDSYESLHNKYKNLETNKSSMSEAEYNKEMGAIVDNYNNLQNDLRAALNDRGFNLPHPSEMLESDAFLSKKQQEKLKEAYNDVIGTLIINSFNKYSKSFNEARKANIRFHEASANMYLTLHNTQLDKALEAKKEKIKESLNTIHKELVQNRLDSANAKRTKNKKPLTYEDMLETMATDQLEFEGLTKQEYKEQVEKPLLKVFPTLNTAFNYAEPRHKRKLSDIRILKSKTTTVDVSDSYQMKTKGADGKVRYKKASVLTQEWVSAAVAPNSAQVQGVDARIAFEAAAMNGNVSLNVHDNVISGRFNYVPMVRVLNKKFYETTRDYHANLASVNAFIDTLEGLVSIKDGIDEEVFNKTVIDSLVGFLNLNYQDKEAYLDATDGDINEIISDVRPQVIHEIDKAIQRDIQKLRHYEKVTVVHQYAGYGGQYELTAEDKAKEKEELAKLEKIQETVKERVTKLLAEISETSTDTLTTKPDEPRKQGFKDLEIEQQEQSLLKPYGLNQLQKSVHKLRDGSAEFKLFDYLVSVAKNNKELTIIMTENLPSKADGMYDNKTNTIYLRPSIMSNNELSADRKIRLINHELLHALTETGLRQGKANNSKAYQDLTKMYEQIKAKANGRFAKELSDIHEFIAYGLTDEKFRKFIADNLDVKDISIKGRFKDTLTKFLAAVHSILGFNTSNNFDKFTKTVHKLIVPYEPILETGKAEQRYSQSDVTSDMSTVEVIQSLDSSMINSKHNQRLNDLTQRIIGIFGMNSNQDTLVDNSKILQSDALVHGFRMSDKEIAVYNSLHAVFTAMETHKANHSYQSLVKLYSDAKKQLSYKDFLTTDRPTSEDILEAKSKYDYLFNSKEHLNDRIAVFASLGLANEEMVNILQKPRQLKEGELNTWFDKLMVILDKVIKALTEKAFFKGGKDFQSQLNVLSDKLLKVDADVRANKRALHERAWQGVGFLTKPLNMAIKSAMRQGIKPATKLKGSDNGILDTIGRTAETFAKLHENGSEEKMQKLIENILSIQKGAYNELGELVNEVSGFVGSGSKRTIERLLRVTQSLGRARDMWKTSVMNNILKEFPNNGKDLTKEQKSAVTRTLLRTDVSSLLDGNNTDYVIRLIKDSKFRKQEIGELHSLILSQGFSKSRANGIIMSAMDLAAYLSHEEVPDNLYKNAEGIARFYGVESDTNILKAIDKLATIQALSYIDNKDIDTVNDMLEKYPDALINLLELHKAYATISKEQEFAQNKYSYQKGYLPQKTNSLRSLQFAKSMQEVEKLKNEGWELITKDPQGMKKDSADHTDPKYLMFHKNINYREYNSGALEMKDTHAKGAIIYTHRDHKDINRYIRDKDKKMVDRNTNVDPKDYNPFENTGNMVMAYDPEGAIINVHYEMRGSTRDKYLERDNNFDVLMGMYAYGINTTPVIREQQKNVAKALYEDFKSSYKREPHLFMVLDPKSKDPKIQEMYRMMPYSFRAQAREMFGQGNPIMVRKSLFLTVFGYRQLSLADLFDKQFNDLGFLGKGFVSGSYLFLGKKAKGRITAAEYFTNKLTKIGKDFIVIRNPKVLKGNIIANSLMLMLHGINPVTVVKEYLRVWKQGRDYVVLEKEMYDLMVEINKAKGKRRQDIQNEINDIQARLVKHPMHVYFKEGIMSSIVDEVQVGETDSYGSIWEEKFDEYKNKLIPKEMQQGIDFFMMNKGSPLHNAMSSATQFSDFSAKVILVEHLKKSGMSEKMAIAEAQETFINYDIPASPMMDYASRMGFFMFINFLKRFQKPLVKSLGRTPASTILQHMITENFTNEAGILDPFILNRIGNNPFDMGMLSAVDAFDDIGTIRLVDAMVPDVF